MPNLTMTLIPDAQKGIYDVESKYFRKKSEANRTEVIVPKWARKVDIDHTYGKTNFHFTNERGDGFIPGFRFGQGPIQHRYKSIETHKSIRNWVIGSRNLDYKLVPAEGKIDDLKVHIKYKRDLLLGTVFFATNLVFGTSTADCAVFI